MYEIKNPRYQKRQIKTPLGVVYIERTLWMMGAMGGRPTIWTEIRLSGYEITLDGKFDHIPLHELEIITIPSGVVTITHEGIKIGEFSLGKNP